MDNEMQQYESFKYLYEYMSNQQDLDNFINESLVLSTGNEAAIEKLRTLNEATDSKLKNFFTRIKQFFQKIFGKMTESINSKIAAAKDYIDNKTYNPIIFKRKYNAGDVTMVDHFTGIANVLKFFENGIDKMDGIIFTTADNSSNVNLGDLSKKIIDGTKLDTIQNIIETGTNFVGNNNAPTKDEFLEVYVPKVMEVYGINNDKINKSRTESGNISVDALFTNYFEASGDPESDVCDVKTFTQEEVNNSLLGIMVNFVYNGADLVKKITNFQEKMNAKFDKKFNELEKEKRTAEKTMQQAINGVAKAGANEVSKSNTETDNKSASQSQTGTDNNAPQKDKKLEADNNSYRILDSELYMKTMLNEVKFSNAAQAKPVGSSNNNQGQPEKQSKVSNSQASAVNTQIGNATKNMNDRNVTGTASMGAAKTLKDKDVTDSDRSNAKTSAANIIAYMDTTCMNEANAMSDIVNTMAIKMKACLEHTLDDYFSVIQAHVKWYINNPNENNNTNQFNRTATNLNVNPNQNNNKQ